MVFLQVISFSTNRLDDFVAVEREWKRVSAFAGSRSAETEAGVVSETGAPGPRVSEVVS
jgi:hypothetical protein